MRIYLAGGYKSEWRRQIRRAFPKWEFVDPFSLSEDYSAEMVENDLTAIKNSDAVLAFYDGHAVYGGTAAEIGYAAAKGIPVFLVWAAERPPELFLVGLSRRLFVTLRQAQDWLKSREEHGRPIR